MRDETRRVAIGQEFEVALPYQAGTGATWIIQVVPQGISIVSETKRGSTTMPGGRIEQLFTLIARKAGQYILQWELVGEPTVIYEIYRLRLQINS